MDLHGNIFKVASVECDFSFAEVVDNEKEELRDRLLEVYFKDEPTLYDLINDDEKWEEYYHELVTDDDPRELFEDHFHRQLTHRYAGTLAGRTTVKPEKIVRQIALFVGTYYIASYIRSKELLLSPEHNLKCANIMLKIEIRSLGKDLERRDDLCDDLLNEIYRHETKIDAKAAENDELILKNKSRLAKIKLLREELKRLGSPGKLGGAKSGGSVDPPPAKSASVKKEKSEKGKKKAAEKEKPPTSESSCTSDEEK